MEPNNTTAIIAGSKYSKCCLQIKQTVFSGNENLSFTVDMKRKEMKHTD